MIARLLLVEDEPSLAQLLVRFLARAGYDVVSCINAAEAQAQWDGRKDNDTRFDVAVVDLGLPDLPGERLAAGFLAGSERVQVIVSSGTPVTASSLGLPEQAVDQGRVHVLQKPYLPGHLVALLARIGSEGVAGPGERADDKL